MTLIPSKARAGIAALTFAAAVAPFVLATPAKATSISFLDGEETVRLEVDGARAPGLIEFQTGEFMITKTFKSNVVDPNVVAGIGGIVFLERPILEGGGVSDFLQVQIDLPDANAPAVLHFTFSSDPNVTQPAGDATLLLETGSLQDVTTLFTDIVTGKGLLLPSDISVFVQSDIEVPGPIVGAGLPGLVAACVGLLALARRRRKLVV